MAGPAAAMDESMRAALAEKGYDLVEKDGSDSDDDPIPGRIKSYEPNVAREKGKKAFEEGKYDKAIRIWQGGLKHILSSLCSGPQALGDMTLSELDLTLNLNIAMAYMKKEEFESADRSVDKALARRDALPPHLITKALYRKASAQRSMKRLDECLTTLKDLLEVESGHAAAKQMQQEVDREWNRQVRDQKQKMKKLFSKIGDEDKIAAERAKAERAEARNKCAVRWTSDDVDSDAFERGETPACDGRDWGLALSRTTLWAIEQLAVEGNTCLPTGQEHASFWFLGASSSCELRWLQPAALMTRLPEVTELEVAMIGFLGELTPDNTREPDPKADMLPKIALESKIDGGQRRVMVRMIKGTLQEALAKDLRPQAPAPTQAIASTEEGAEAAVPAAEGAEVIVPTEESAEAATASKQQAVPPTVCFIAHPQLHRYFSDFFPAIQWLIQQRVPTIIIGASEPDLSWKQDEILLKSLGANIVVHKRESPYPMCLADNPDVRKCSHIIGFLGGKAVERERLTKIKLELLSQDYTVR